MPEISAFVGSLREAFGADEINDLIRRGRAGEPVFFAAENGLEFGTRAPAGLAWNTSDVESRHFCAGCNGECVGTGVRCSQRTSSVGAIGKP
jgi:hypothetical protein